MSQTNATFRRNETENSPDTLKRKKCKVKVFNKKNRPCQENVSIERLREKYQMIDTAEIKYFSDFPLSSKTLRGLKQSGYIKPTEIQLKTIGLALQGKDVLGAAQTGSGKTIAFIVPILELLFCKRWTHLDGLGALIITPTRELAYQIFEALRKIGIFHDFSAGLIIGGKDLKFERKRMNQCNIVVCTPGRLLQHMDENPLFDCVNMQVLVLDEADRCLDMGFEGTVNAILANLPPKRQTLLFSATQTKSVKDLARLSLKDPLYVSVYKKSEFNTPDGLQQSYVICNLEDKLAIVWSFIKNHLKQKSIVFFSSCKQVKYIYEMFCRLRPGVSLLALYGTLHQLRRMEIYESFCRKNSAVLLATDLAARGLDFPEVHWVVQADCPEDAATYVHRAGRTARFHRNGESLLLLLPTEARMLSELRERNIPINKIEINPVKLQNPVRKMEAFLARDPILKETAQRAFVSYAKAVFLMKDKIIFNVQKLNTDAFAKSLGLAIPPRIRFLQRLNSKLNVCKKNDRLNTRDVDEGADDDCHDDNDVNANRRPFNVSDDSDTDGSILKVKRTDHDIDLPSESEKKPNEPFESRNKIKKCITKAAIAKKLMKKNIKPNKKIVFDDAGEIIGRGMKEKQSIAAQQYENDDDEGGIDIQKAREVLREEDKYDKQLFKEKIKAKHKDQKRKLKEIRKERVKEATVELDDESGSEPDLSWLPDPEKVYDTENRKDIVIHQHSCGVFQGEALINKKRKAIVEKQQGGAERKKKQKIDAVSSDLTVHQAEELALMLLKNK